MNGCVVFGIALFCTFAVAVPNKEASRNGQIRQKPVIRAVDANQFVLQKNPIAQMNNPYPVAFPAPQSPLAPPPSGPPLQPFPPTYFIPGEGAFLGPSPVAPVPPAPRPYSFPGGPCAPLGGRPGCVASSICTSGGACECPYGFAASRFFCFNPVAPPAPVVAPSSVISPWSVPPPAQPVGLLPTFPGSLAQPVIAPSPAIPQSFLPPVHPAPAAPVAGPPPATLLPPGQAPWPLTLDIPIPLAAIRWLLIGILPVKERPIVPPGPVFPAVQPEIMSPFPVVPPTNSPLVPSGPPSTPWFPAHADSVYPIPSAPPAATWPFTPQNAPQPGSLTLPFAGGQYPLPAGTVPQPVMPAAPLFSPPQAVPVSQGDTYPFYTAPGSMLSPTGMHLSSPWGGALQATKAARNEEYFSAGNAGYAKPTNMMQQAFDINDRLTANSRFGFRFGHGASENEQKKKRAR